VCAEFLCVPPYGRRGNPRRRNPMNDELLASIEREVLGWPGVDKDPDRAHVALYGSGGVSSGTSTPRRSGRPPVPQGRPRRPDLGRPGGTVPGRLPGHRELPRPRAGGRAGGRGPVPQEPRPCESRGRAARGAPRPLTLEKRGLEAPDPPVGVVRTDYPPGSAGPRGFRRSARSAPSTARRRR
jgi:hypothetical protein